MTWRLLKWGEGGEKRSKRCSTAEGIYIIFCNPRARRFSALALTKRRNWYENGIRNWYYIYIYIYIFTCIQTCTHTHIYIQRERDMPCIIGYVILRSSDSYRPLIASFAFCISLIAIVLRVLSLLPRVSFKRKNEDSRNGVPEYTFTEASGGFPLRATSRIKECSLPLASRNDAHLYGCGRVKRGISRAGDNDLSYDRVSIFVRGGQVRRLVFET